LPEVAGSAALLVDASDTEGLAEAIQRVSQDRDLRENMVEAGYKQAARFGWDAAAQRLLHVYKRFLAGSD
jgi:glycosyltransferase involved in cell wall biosynthesis